MFTRCQEGGLSTRQQPQHPTPAHWDCSPAPPPQPTTYQQSPLTPPAPPTKATTKRSWEASLTGSCGQDGGCSEASSSAIDLLRVAATPAKHQKVGKLATFETISSITGCVAWKLPSEWVATSETPSSPATQSEDAANKAGEISPIGGSDNSAASHTIVTGSRKPVKATLVLLDQEYEARSKVALSGSRGVHEFALSPGHSYSVQLILQQLVTNKIVRLSQDEQYKAVFSKAELSHLMEKAATFVGEEMHSFSMLYRVKNMDYWKEFLSKKVLTRTLKTNTGHAASTINGKLEGIFFHAQLIDGHFPTRSPFGEILLRFPAYNILEPSRINIYFADFFCMRDGGPHNITIVVTERGSASDIFCQAHLPQLDCWSNPFLRFSISTSSASPISYWVSSKKRVWVELFWTGRDISLEWAILQFEQVEKVGFRKAHGRPSNVGCIHCNIYSPSLQMATIDEFIRFKSFFLGLIDRIQYGGGTTSARPPSSSEDAKSNENNKNAKNRDGRPKLAKSESNLSMIPTSSFNEGAIISLISEAQIHHHISERGADVLSFTMNPLIERMLSGLRKMVNDDL